MIKIFSATFTPGCQPEKLGKLVDEFSTGKSDFTVLWVQSSTTDNLGDVNITLTAIVTTQTPE
ncbi:MAG: hypothetical protein WC107_06540 [Patescibacteria group bacterium]